MLIKYSLPPLSCSSNKLEWFSFWSKACTVVGVGGRTKQIEHLRQQVFCCIHFLKTTCYKTFISPIPAGERPSSSNAKTHLARAQYSEIYLAVYRGCPPNRG